MSNMSFKKLTVLILLLISATLILYVYSEIWLVRWDDRLSPRTPNDDTIITVTTYRINPGTILEDLKNGRGDLFTVIGPDSEISPLGSNSFLWKGEDYLNIAKAVHEREWNESLENWHLYSLRFSIRRCQRVEEGIDSAEILYFQRQENKYVVHGIRINPLFEEASVGENQYPYSEEWTPIDLDKLLVNTPNAALELAEANGGRKAREKQGETGCYIAIHLNPESRSPNLFLDTFKFYDLKWEIEYRGDNAIIFSDLIDPYTGK